MASSAGAFKILYQGQHIVHILRHKRNSTEKIKKTCFISVFAIKGVNTTKVTLVQNYLLNRQTNEQIFYNSSYLDFQLKIFTPLPKLCLRIYYWLNMSNHCGPRNFEF